MKYPTRRVSARVLGFILVSCLMAWMSLPASASVARPAIRQMVTLTIVTVPHLPSARFAFDGQEVSSDSKGVVRLSVEKGRMLHTLTLLTTTINNGDTQAQFARWWGQPNHDQDYKPNLTGLKVEQSKRLQVAFRVSYLVRYRIVNQNHQPVDQKRIQQVVLSSDTGNLITTHGGQVRLTGYRPALQNGTLAEKQAVFSLWAITIDGSNAVHQGQKRFLPSVPRDRNLEFVVPLKSITVTANDRLFGNGVGSGVELTFPNQSHIIIPFGNGHTLTIRNLVRGNYRIRLVNSHGFGGTRALALSRNQNVVLKIWNFMDIAVLLAVVLVLAAVSILGGRLGNRRPQGQHRAPKEMVP